MSRKADMSLDAAAAARAAGTTGVSRAGLAGLPTQRLSGVGAGVTRSASACISTNWSCAVECIASS